jgi:hypothetical protein
VALQTSLSVLISNSFMLLVSVMDTICALRTVGFYQKHAA